MKKLGVIVLLLGLASPAFSGESDQKLVIRDREYQIQGYYSNGVIRDRDYTIQGYVSKDGTIRDKYYRPEGHIEKGGYGNHNSYGHKSHGCGRGRH